ncbi:MAG: dephospho-CoA kinase [Eubacterium sp.]|nr:dephospho-CoA kinase [Eubacterium sp.]
MKVIGITGGIGAGKSAVLSFIEENYAAKVLLADEIAHQLMEPGTDCYNKIKETFEDPNLFFEDGTIDRKWMAQTIFSDEEKRLLINDIVHPAVKQYIHDAIEAEREKDVVKYLIVESALPSETQFHTFAQEVWYVYAGEEVRRQRLKEQRGYSDEKISEIFATQITDEEYRKACDRIIDNDAHFEQMKLQVSKYLMGEDVEFDEDEETTIEKEQDMAEEKVESKFVFGLDIGTRNVVGTVGYKEDDEFFVAAQYSVQHETRAMLDGQIHDIGRVGRTVQVVKESLEQQIGEPLHEVCIAAAGRVLKTVTTNIEYEFPEEKIVTGEDIHTLELLGIEKAQNILKEKNDTKYHFYCVGYSVVKYYLEGDMMSNLESHKAETISADIIVTFLPEDVVDGLYTSVGIADLKVANMTLEPIAAINVAIPENFRMLNIALVDVGAGTSDISVTRDGSIIAYGMIPHAGDEITEVIVQNYLVDFKTAEHIKLTCEVEDEIEYTDIMNISHTIPSSEVWELVAPTVEKITGEIASKIKELNGGKSVAATFVVGGGGKIHGFTENLAKLLDIAQERVALRGEEVLQSVRFAQEDIVKDPLLVTPIGICLNYYDQKNNFIFVRFNGERIKLYDNDKLTIVDAAMQAGFPNEYLFPRRGKEISFTVNGKSRIVRGTPGESAIVKVNDKIVNINTPLEANSDIVIEPSTTGAAAEYTLEQLPEYENSKITFEVNGKAVTCPRFAEVNGVLEPPFYQIKEDDIVVMRSYYTVQQIAEFMDVELDPDAEIIVNNRVEDLNALVYENFSVEWTTLNFRTPEEDLLNEDVEEGSEEEPLEQTEEGEEEKEAEDTYENEFRPNLEEKKEKEEEKGPITMVLLVTVNGQQIQLEGKERYVFVDVFDYIDFNLADANGRAIATKVNGADALYTQTLNAGDNIEIYWKE